MYQCSSNGFKPYNYGSSWSLPLQLAAGCAPLSMHALSNMLQKSNALSHPVQRQLDCCATLDKTPTCNSSRQTRVHTATHSHCPETAHQHTTRVNDHMPESCKPGSQRHAGYVHSTTWVMQLCWTLSSPCLCRSVTFSRSQPASQPLTHTMHNWPCCIHSNKTHARFAVHHAGTPQEKTQQNTACNNNNASNALDPCVQPVVATVRGASQGCKQPCQHLPDYAHHCSTAKLVPEPTP